MSKRDILSGYGRDTPQPQASVAKGGGVMTAKELPCRPPVGPKTVNNPNSPGLHGSNHGNNGTQGKH